MNENEGKNELNKEENELYSPKIAALVCALSLLLVMLVFFAYYVFMSIRPAIYDFL